jgi:hypothetical protein
MPGKGRLQNTKYLNDLISQIGPSHKEKAQAIVNLYGDGKIHQVTTAENAISNLRKGGDKGERAYNSIMSKYSKEEHVAVRMKRTRLHNKTKYIKQYMVTGTVTIKNTYVSTTKTRQTHTHIETKDYPIGLVIEARSKEEAMQIYEDKHNTQSSIDRVSHGIRGSRAKGSSASSGKHAAVEEEDYGRSGGEGGVYIRLLVALKVVLQLLQLK